MRSAAVAAALCLLACKHGKPRITVQVATPQGWDSQHMLIDGQEAVFGERYGTFAGESTSAPLPATVTSLAGRAVELVISPTPCGAIRVPGTLSVVTEHEDGLTFVHVTPGRSAPVMTQFFLDVPDAKEVKIGSYVVPSDELEKRRVDLYEVACAPLTVTVDGKPLDVLEDGVIPGEDVTLDPSTHANPAFVAQPQTAAYLVTTDTCHREEKTGYGSDRSHVAKDLTGAGVHELAWSRFDDVFQRSSATAPIVSSLKDKARTGTFRRALYRSLECPSAAPSQP